MIIDESQNHTVSITITSDGYKLLHCNVMQWNRGLKKRLLNLLKTLGTCYSIVDDEALKFNKLMGGKHIGYIDADIAGVFKKNCYFMRFN
tara:strand:- start:242 stop:511 length:270 start_codon:yes stop_codon:yes gene_type:complete